MVNGVNETLKGILMLGLLILSVLPGIWASHGEATPTAPLPVVHEGDLILNGSQVFIIKGQDFIQRGNIYITENATLKIINSKLQLGEEDDDKWYRFEASGSSRIIAENSTFWPDVSIKLNESARAEFLMSELSYPYPIHNVTYDASRLSAFGNASIECRDSQVGNILVFDSAICRVFSSSIGWFHPYSARHSVIANSTIRSLWLYFKDGEADVNRSLHGFHPFWASEELASNACLSHFEVHNTTILNPASLYLENCSLEVFGARLTMVHSRNCSRVSIGDAEIKTVYLEGDSEATFQNSSIGYMDCSLGSLVLVARDSIFNSVKLWPSTLGLIVQNCSIEEMEVESLWMRDASNEIIIENTILGNLTLWMWVERPVEYLFKNAVIQENLFLSYGAWSERGGLIIRGGLRFGENASVRVTLPNGYHRIKREYEVVAYRGAEPLRGAELELRRGDETVWRGESDAEGRARFNLTFIDVFKLVQPYVPGEPSVLDMSNITQTLTLTASDGREIAEVEVELLSDTPIVFTFERPRSTLIFWMLAIGLAVILTLIILQRTGRLKRGAISEGDVGLGPSW